MTDTWKKANDLLLAGQRLMDRIPKHALLRPHLGIVIMGEIMVDHGSEIADELLAKERGGKKPPW